MSPHQGRRPSAQDRNRVHQAMKRARNLSNYDVDSIARWVNQGAKDN